MTLRSSFNESVHAIMELEKKAEEVVHDAMETALDAARHPGKIVNMTREFFRLEAAGGLVLVGAAILALICANTPLYHLYHYFFNEVNFAIGFANNGGWEFTLEKSLLLWINDGLMAIFFFLVGLEIKRELSEGTLSDKKNIVLPAMAAIGGMAIPALIYVFLNMDAPHNMHGWAIPAATDIAFALGVLALVGSRAPVSLKILLTAVAIIDDVGAIIIIALFYSEQFSPTILMTACLPLAALVLLNWRGASSAVPYILLGVVLWVLVLKSGVHATLAGLTVALFIPMRCRTNPRYSPAKFLEHELHPWVAFMILPVFAFANAGVPLNDIGFANLLNPVTLGIALGLFAGKQLGVFAMLWMVIKLGWAPKPAGTNWTQLYAVSILCGIGFTMSLFIGSLAFPGDMVLQAGVRVGVLLGSLASAVLAYVLLRYGPTTQMQVKQHV